MISLNTAILWSIYFTYKAILNQHIEMDRSDILIQRVDQRKIVD